MNFDINKSKQIFVDTSQHTVGDDQLLRSTFEVYFPHILKLRNAGYSFKQIADLLEQCDLSLDCSMVEQYFEDQLMEKRNKNAQLIDEMTEIIRQFTEANQDKNDTEKVVPVTSAGMRHTTTSSPNEGLHCLALLPVKPLERRDGVPEEVYMDGQLEHPAIPGLMLSKDERLYGKQLEVVDHNGEAYLESVKDRIFRIKWVKPISRIETETGANFVKMNYELFKYVGTGKLPE
ncbi:hypothetical protein FERRO_06130 [Ferrovum sp. JA12]|uniref:hypothetical protein n=1 Tax=Ferrovum sp. JA12 TaxID=1356299 RepID=UPI0007035FBE|nr:hypothetical protein [Ferrovum sp. JA12]KRH79545.1 hypothetical protein FERRO_06130 [Ferrovum sp. JA12]